MSLTQSQIEKKLSDENLDELLDLWRTEQGAEKRRDLDLMAAAIPFSTDAILRVLDWRAVRETSGEPFARAILRHGSIASIATSS